MPVDLIHRRLRELETDRSSILLRLQEAARDVPVAVDLSAEALARAKQNVDELHLRLQDPACREAVAQFREIIDHVLCTLPGSVCLTR
jgi:hypothetical protein